MVPLQEQTDQGCSMPLRTGLSSASRTLNAQKTRGVASDRSKHSCGEQQNPVDNRQHQVQSH